MSLRHAFFGILTLAIVGGFSFIFLGSNRKASLNSEDGEVLTKELTRVNESELSKEKKAQEIISLINKSRENKPFTEKDRGNNE